MIKRLLLAGSIVANVALGFLVFSHASAEVQAQRAALAAASSAAGSGDRKAALDSVDPKTWGHLATDDPATLAARLRAEGFPPILQRAMLATLIRQRFADRHKALDDLIAGGAWWRDNFGYTANLAKVRVAQRLLEHDERVALDAVLDPTAGLTGYAIALQAHRYGDRLPLAKTLALDRIKDDYSDQTRDIEDAVLDMLRPEDNAKIAYLQKQQTADIEQLLTPEELAEYNFHTDGTAKWLGGRLAVFDPSDDEFRAIYKIHQAGVAQADSPNPPTPAQRRANDAAQLAAALSPERYDEYQQKTDPAYLDASAIVERLQLPATATADVVAVQKDITARADAFKRDPSLTAGERSNRLAALGAEAVARLTPTLGDTGVVSYLDHGGYWIKALKPPVPPVSGPKP